MRVRLPVISDLYANVWSGMDVSLQDCPTGARESHEYALKLPFAELRLHAQRRRLLGSNYVALWHETEIRQRANLWPVLSLKPTLGQSM